MGWMGPMLGGLGPAGNPIPAAPQQPDPRLSLRAIARGAGNLAQGAARSFAGPAVRIGEQLAEAVPGGPTPAQAEQRRQANPLLRWATAPQQGLAQELGAGAEQAGESLLMPEVGLGDVGPLTRLAGRAGIGAAKGTGLALAHGATPQQAGWTGALSGTLGAAIPPGAGGVGRRLSQEQINKIVEAMIRRENMLP